MRENYGEMLKQEVVFSNGTTQFTATLGKLVFRASRGQFD